MYIGIDLGTSSVKMILCDGEGNVLKSVTEKYPIYYPKDGYSEQNPNDWYEKTIAGLKKLTDGYGDEIRAIGVAGQMHGLVMLDENDCVIRNAILWNDSRSVKKCDYLNNVIGKEKLTDMTANIAFPGFTAPKIMWVRDNEKENFARCKKIMLPKDYIIYRLTGEFVTDVSDVSGMLLYDVKNRCYNKEMLEICSVDIDMLPSVKESYEKCGTVKREIADKLKWGDVSVAAGAGDNAAAAIGLGVVEDGMCSISLGTSGTVFIANDEFAVDGGNALHSFCHANGKYHLMGCILSAASCNKWWIEDVLNSTDYAMVENECADGENKVFFLPYMMGERSPHNDPYARGTFAGMSMDTKQSDMGKAVLEGVCYALRDCVEAAKECNIKITQARVCGGGAKSRLWMQMLANVLKTDVVKPMCEEGPSYGGAILAMVADGKYESVKEACDSVVKMKEKITYNPVAAEKYDAGYEKFRKLYLCLKDWFKYEA